MYQSVQQQSRHFGRAETRIWTILFTLLFLLSSSLAIEIQDEPGFKSSLFKRLEHKGQIYYDRRDPPIPYERRQEIASSTISDTRTSSSSDSSPSSDSQISSASATKTVTTAPSITIVTTPLPSPFDTFLGSNFTEPSCPDYFTKFLSNSTFQSCIPVSLLLRNSISFFQTERNPDLLSETLDAACNATFATCTETLSDIASQLISDSNCGKDFKLQNPLVSQAYAGLISYEPVYRATCLKNPNTGTYCFGEAVSNVNNPADPYPYFTALGMNLPATAKPTCNPCLQHTMQIFASFAKNAEQPLSDTYLGCAHQIDSSCGTGYADINVKVGSVAAPSTASTSSISFLMMGIMGLTILWLGMI